MKTSDFLRAAKARIDTPEKWISGNVCPLIAIWQTRAAVGLPFRGSDTADFALARCLGYDGPEGLRNLPAARAFVYAYNDAQDTTHADIMALFDRAIAAEEAAEGLRFPSEWVRTEVPA